MKSNLALYALSTLLVLATISVLSSLGVSNPFLAAYVPLAFFAVAGLDFYRTQVLEGGASEVLAYARVTPSRSGVYLDEHGFARVARIGETNGASMSTGTASGGSSYADRFLAYLFVAPFIFPARVYQQFTSR